MAAVVGNELSRTYNWHGKKGKKAFKDLQLAKIVYGKQWITESLAVKCAQGLNKIFHAAVSEI